MSDTTSLIVLERQNQLSLLATLWSDE